MDTKTRYEEPMPLDAGKPAYFYHTMAFPDGTLVQGDWDLRPCLSEYTGGVDFKNKWVLDIGAATGALSFYAEAQGAAEVVSFDQSPEHPLNLLPEWDQSLEAIDNMKRSYWICHKNLESQTKVVYGNIYDLPFGEGRFDVAILGSVLLHLESPFTAIRNACRVAKTVVITEVLRPFTEIRFRPCYPGEDYLVWWYLPPAEIFKMLRSLGFSSRLAAHFKAISPRHGSCHFFSIVGEKSTPLPSSV